MSETQEAPGGAAPEPAPTPAPDVSQPQQDQREPSENAERSAREGQPNGKGEPEAQAGKGNKPEREPWFVKRIAELTREKADRDRVLAQAERKLRELQPQAEPQQEDPARAVETRAQQLVAEREFNAACNAEHAKGVAAFPDFADAMQALGSAGGLPNAVIEAALETGEAHKVLYQLGRDPEQAMRIRDMTPARMGVAMAQLAAQPVAAAPVTKAPPPVRSISGGNVRANDDPEKMSMAEYTAWRAKQEAARRVG